MVLLIGIIIFSLDVNAVIIDKEGILNSETKNVISEFNTYGFLLSVAIENYAEIPSDAAIKLYNKNNQDILIFFVLENKETVIVQLGEDIIENEKLRQIGKSYEKQRLEINNNKDINDYLINIILSLKDEIKGEKKTINTKQDTLIKSKEKIAVCVLLKDGYCDKNCVDDPDCECGDGICQSHENSATCPADCEEEKDISCGIIKDNVCDPACDVRDIDCKVNTITEWLIISENEEENNVYYIIMAILIFFLILCSIIALLLVHEVIEVRQ